MEYIITKATATQAPTIARFIMMAMSDDCCLHFAGEGHGLDDFYSMMTDLVAQDKSQYSYRNTLVALDGDRVVGIATSYDGGSLHQLREAFVLSAKHYLGRDWNNIDDETQPGELYLDSLAVDELYRGKGIAKKLINATVERAREMEIPLVGLLVDAGNPQAERLYSSIGFVCAGDTEWGGHPMHHLVLHV